MHDAHTRSYVGISLLEIECCDCHPVDVRLLYAGYFPCAPHKPSVAFSLDGLEMMKNVWGEIAPNVTGWAEGWEKNLRDRKYQYGDPVSTSYSQVPTQKNQDTDTICNFRELYGGDWEKRPFGIARLWSCVMARSK